MAGRPAAYSLLILTVPIGCWPKMSWCVAMMACMTALSASGFCRATVRMIKNASPEEDC